MQKNMNSTPPRLPRLGGHKSTPTRKPSPVPTSPSGPSSLNPSARIEPARASNSPERPYIDVGYDDDEVPYAQQQVHLLSSLRGTAPAAPQQQAPSPHRPKRPSSSSSSLPSTAQSWKEQVRAEVLLGTDAAKPPTATPPTANTRRDEFSSGDSDEEMADVSVDAATPPDSADRLADISQNLFPSMPDVLPTVSLNTAAGTAAATTPAPVIPITGIPKSPVSLASSLATDTPRSILRHPGREREPQPPRAGRRRISFVDLSPLRDSSPSSNGSPHDAARRRESLSGDDDDDEYDFAEPLLRYQTDTPPTSTRNAVPERQLRDSGDSSSASPSPSRSPDRRGSGEGRGAGSRDARPATAATARAAAEATIVRPTPPSPSSSHSPSPASSASASPERPVKAGRSPTRSPPRDDDGVRRHHSSSAPGAARPAAGGGKALVASAPPPPEEENDLITLDQGTPVQVHADRLNKRFQEGTRNTTAAAPPAVDSRSPTPPQRSPDRAAKSSIEAGKRSPSRSASNGRDEDVVTQPHNHSHRTVATSNPTTAATAAKVTTATNVAPAGRRPPSRQRWPSDAYLDEPPTEVSTTQRADRTGGPSHSHRESLDPDDDMGSSRSSRDTSLDDYSSHDTEAAEDDDPSFHYTSPVKETESAATSAAHNARERSADAAAVVSAAVDRSPTPPSPKAASPVRSPPRDAPARDRTKTPSQSQPRSPGGRLPERRRSLSIRGSRASSAAGEANGSDLSAPSQEQHHHHHHHHSRSRSQSSPLSSPPPSSQSSSHRERPIPSTPPSLTDGLDSGMLRHRHSPSRGERSASSLHESTSLPTSVQEPSASRRVETTPLQFAVPLPPGKHAHRALAAVTAALAPVAIATSRETSHSGSRGRSPSSITNRSSGQSVGEEAAPAAPAPQARPSQIRSSTNAAAPSVRKSSPVPSRSSHNVQELPEAHRHRHKHRHRSTSRHASSVASSSHRSSRVSSARSSPQRAVPPAPAAVTAAPNTADMLKPAVAEIKKRPKKVTPDEPQVYVDPLLKERQQRHKIARQQSPTHLAAARSPSRENVLPTRRDDSAEKGKHRTASAAGDGVAVARSPAHQRHSSRYTSPEKRNGDHGGSSGNGKSSGGGVFEPVSLRDIMARHDTPEAKAATKKHATASSRVASTRSISSEHAKADDARKPTARQILRKSHAAERDAKGKTRKESPSHSRTSSERARAKEEETKSSSSRLSSGGVAAEDLVWDAPTPASRASSSSPPVSPTAASSAAGAAGAAGARSTSSGTEAVSTSPGGHKVFRKKLVKVVRRRRSGALPSEEDPVMRVSMVPFREGSPEVRHAEEQQAALQRAREARQQQRQHQERDAEEGSVGHRLRHHQHYERSSSTREDVSSTRSTGSKASHRSGEKARQSASRGGGSGMGAISIPSAAGAPPLERLIDHIQPGRGASVTSRHASRPTHIREERVGEKDSDDDGSRKEGGSGMTEEDRRQFRRALSVASSRSASRRSSVARSATSRRSPARSSTHNPSEHPSSVAPDKEKEEDEKKKAKSRPERRSASADEETGATHHSSRKSSVSHRSSVNSSEQRPSSLKRRTSRSSSASTSHHASKEKAATVSALVAEKPKMAASAAGGKVTPRKDESTMTRVRHHHHRTHHSTHRSVSRRDAAEEPRRSSSAKPTDAVSPPSSSTGRRSVPQQTELQAQPEPQLSIHVSTPSQQPLKSNDQQLLQQQKRQPQLPAELPDAPYNATQNDEFYYGGGLTEEVAALRQHDASQRIGISPVAMPSLLPRLALASDFDGDDPHGNNGAADGVAAWSATNSEAEGLEKGAERFAVVGGSWRQRRLLEASATQTNRGDKQPTASAVDAEDQGGYGQSGMPLTAGTPVARPVVSVTESIAAAAPREPVELIDGPLRVGPVDPRNEREAAAQGNAAVSAEGDSESPASFVKRTKTPAPKPSARRAAAAPAANTGFGSTASAPIHIMPQTPQTTYGPTVYGQQPQQLPPPQQTTPFAGYPAPVAATAYPNPAMAGGAVSQPVNAVPAGVPLFVPQLTVDNVSHLTQDWQSTLRERSGKTKQSAMEQFLIASAEAGAASTLSAGLAQPPPPLQPNAVPFNGYTNAAAVPGVGVAAYGGPVWGSAQQWPVQTQPGMPAGEFYGQTAQPQPQPQQLTAGAALTTAPLPAAQTSPPRLLPQAFWEAERQVREKDAKVAAAVAAASARVAASKRKPAVWQGTPAAATTVNPAKPTGASKSCGSSSAAKADASPRSTSAHPPADAFALVEGSEAAAHQSSRSSSSSSSKTSNSGTADDSGRNTPERAAAVAPLTQPRSRHRRSLTPPTAAALASEQSPPQQPQPASQSRHRHRRSGEDAMDEEKAEEVARHASARPALSEVLSPSAEPAKLKEHRTRRTASAAAIAIATSGRRHASRPRTPAGFTVAEPEPEISKSKRDKDSGHHSRPRRASPHAADAHHRGRSSGAPSAVTLPKHERSSKERKDRRKETRREDDDMHATRRGAREKEEEEKKAKRRKASQGRHSRDKTARHRAHSVATDASSISDASSASRFSIPDVFNFAHYKPALEDVADDEDGDIDSDLTTSMEFQLSRLLLRREKDVSLALTSLQQEQEKAEARRRRKAEKKEKEKALQREREKAKARKREKEKAKEREAAQEKAKSRHHRRHRSNSSAGSDESDDKRGISENSSRSSRSSSVDSDEGAAAKRRKREKHPPKEEKKSRDGRKEHGEVGQDKKGRRQRDDEKRHRSSSVASKPAKKREKERHKSKEPQARHHRDSHQHRSKSSAKHDPLPLPPPPSHRPRDGWAEEPYTPPNRTALTAYGEDRYTSPVYESLGATRDDAASPYTRRDYPASASYRANRATAEENFGLRSPSAQSYFRSRSGGLDNNDYRTYRGNRNDASSPYGRSAYEADTPASRYGAASPYDNYRRSGRGAEAKEAEDDFGRSLGGSRYAARHRPYTPSATASRWADTPRRFSDEDTSSRPYTDADVSPSSRYRSRGADSGAARPSTQWTDYVRAAERTRRMSPVDDSEPYTSPYTRGGGRYGGAAATPASRAAPSAAAASASSYAAGGTSHYTSYGQRRQGGRVADDATSPASRTDEGGTRASPYSATSRYHASYTSRADAFADIDDIPTKSYFNDDNKGSTDQRSGAAAAAAAGDDPASSWSSYAARTGGGATSYRAAPYRRHDAGRGGDAPPPPPPPPPSASYDRRRRSTTAPSRRKDDDILVSTPSQDNDRDGSYDYWEDRATDATQSRRAGKAATAGPPPPPPPPTPPAEAQNSTTRPPSASGQSFTREADEGKMGFVPSAKALPIVSEHNVTEAQAAHDFADGVKEIVSALRHYKEQV